MSGQAVLLAPVAYYWWSRELPRTPGEVPFLPIISTVALLTLAALLAVLYHLYCGGVRGSSPGKELLELRVEAEDGTCPIGLGRAALRLFGYLLSAASFALLLGPSRMTAAGISSLPRLRPNEALLTVAFATVSLKG